MTGPHLFNIVYPDGGPQDLAVYFYAGDMLAMETDILVISAFQGSYHPVGGTLFGQLASRYRFYVPENELERISEHLLRLPVRREDGLPCKTILIVEMNHRHGSARDIMLRTFSELVRYLPDLIGPNDRRISFPLLGTGAQQLPRETAAIELLRLTSTLTGTSLREIRIFAYDFESIGLLNTNIDSHLNRPRDTVTDHALLRAIHQDIQNLPPGLIAPILEEVQQYIQLITVPELSIVPAAMVGRLIAERIALVLVQRHELLLDPLSTLEMKLSALKPILLSDPYPRYALSYLRLLQSIGNAAAHLSRTPLTSNDIIAVGVAIIRLVQIMEPRRIPTS